MAAMTSLTWNDLPGAATRAWGLTTLREMARDYLATLARQQPYGDVVRQRILRERIVDVFDPELLRRLMLEHADALIRWERGPEVFSQTLGQSVLVTEGPVWHRQRRLLMPAFAHKRMAGYAAFMVDAGSAGLDRIQPGPVEMSGLFSHITMDVILRVLFGTQAGDQAAPMAAATQHLSEVGFREMFWPMTLPDWLPLPGKAKKRRSLRSLFGFLQQQLDAPPRPDGADLLSGLRALRDEHDGAVLSEQAVFDECMTIFQAGHETTATALLWWSWLMASHPEAQARAAAEVAAVIGRRLPTADDAAALPWLSASLKEAMRLYPPAAALMTRRLSRGVTLPWQGRQLQLDAGVMLRVTPYLLHRDPRWWTEPEAYRPERFMPGAPEVPRGAYLPFGQGPRVCLGQHFAMLEMTLVAALLLQRFELQPGNAAAPKPRLAVTLRPEGGLTLALQPRRPA